MRFIVFSADEVQNHGFLVLEHGRSIVHGQNPIAWYGGDVDDERPFVLADDIGEDLLERAIGLLELFEASEDGVVNADGDAALWCVFVLEHFRFLAQVSSPFSAARERLAFVTSTATSSWSFD